MKFPWRKVAVVTIAIAAIAIGIPWWMTSMPGKSFAGVPSPVDAEKRGRLDRDVRMLSIEIGERTTELPDRLDRARDWVEEEFRNAGYTPERQTYDVGGVACSNVEAHVGGGSEIVVIGAHYDSAIGAPAADDNATGVAAMLEIARTIKQCKRTLRFVAFVNEEMPHFAQGTMGSQMYAKRSAERHENIVAMMSLETIGYYKDAPGTQRLPFPMDLFYPDRGNYLAFVANTSSRALVRRVVGTFRKSAELPSEGGAVPENIIGVRYSDHAPFWDRGWPALMVTDTAFMRNPNYHTRRDLPDTLDFDRLTGAVIGLEAVTRELCEGA